MKDPGEEEDNDQEEEEEEEEFDIEDDRYDKYTGDGTDFE